MVHYPPGYPDELPEISLRYDDTSVNDDDEKNLTEELLKIVSLSVHFTQLRCGQIVTVRAQRTWEWQ